MSKFSRKGKKGQPAISTASLPDIVFMLLFFFMVTTVMREVELKVNVKIPEATEIIRLENRAYIDYIYVGTPTDERYGSEPVIQLNDQYAALLDVRPFIETARLARQEAEWPFLITALKVDQEAKMGIVTDIKQELREAQALKLIYSANERATPQ